jgi:hypothetical protein
MRRTAVAWLLIVVMIGACQGAPVTPAPTAVPAPSTLGSATLAPSVPPVTAPPPSEVASTTLAEIRLTDVEALAAATGQSCVKALPTIECETTTQAESLQARTATDGIHLEAVTAQAMTSDELAFTYFTKVCGLTGSYAEAVVSWLAARRDKTDVAKVFGPYVVEFWGPPRVGILSIRPAP